MKFKKIFLSALVMVSTSLHAMNDAEHEKQWHVLFAAILDYNTQKIVAVLDSGFDINKPNQGGLLILEMTLRSYYMPKNMMLHTTTHDFFKETIQLLLDRGASAEKKDGFGFSALANAKSHDDKEMIALLSPRLAQQKLAEEKSQEVFDAIDAKDYAKLRHLRAQFPFYYVKDNKGNNPLHRAIINNDLETFRFILQRQPQLVDMRNNRGELPIELAAGKPKILKEFSEAKLK